jgi:hypothetical protein
MNPQYNICKPVSILLERAFLLMILKVLGNYNRFDFKKFFKLDSAYALLFIKKALFIIRIIVPATIGQIKHLIFMKRLPVTLAISLFILFSCDQPAQTDVEHNASWSDVEQDGHGIITLAYVASEGFSYTDDEGNLTGVTIELMRDFTEYVNETYDVEIEMVYIPIERFSEFYDFVKHAEGGVFGVANVTITEQRADELAFSPSYMTNIATLVTHSDVPEISGFNEIGERFNGLDALAFEGTLHEVRVREIVDVHIPDAKIKYAHSNSEIIERVASENRYFAYVDIYNYWRAADRGRPLKRHAAADEASERFGVIMPRKSDWEPLMVEFFEQDGGYIHSVRYRELMEEHLGSELAGLLLGR